MKITKGKAYIMQKILLDTDIGCDMDDMLALGYLLAREDVELLGITTVTGEPEVRAALADMMCRLAGKDVPVSIGAGTGRTGEFRQKTVIRKEKALLDDFAHSTTFGTDAVGFLHETITSHPHEVTLCAIGPLTNLAELFLAYPETPSMLKRLVIMGGRYGDVDTERWGVQEWNILNDPVSADIVFRAPVPDVLLFGVEQTCRVFRTDTEALADAVSVCPWLVPFSRAIRTGREAWYHDAVAVSALFHTDGMRFGRGQVRVSGCGDTVFTPDEAGNHVLMTAMDIPGFFSHFHSVIGIHN